MKYYKGLKTTDTVVGLNSSLFVTDNSDSLLFKKKNVINCKFIHIIYIDVEFIYICHASSPLKTEEKQSINYIH